MRAERGENLRCLGTAGRAVLIATRSAVVVMHGGACLTLGRRNRAFPWGVRKLLGNPPGDGFAISSANSSTCVQTQGLSPQAEVTWGSGHLECSAFISCNARDECSRSDENFVLGGFLGGAVEAANCSEQAKGQTRLMISNGTSLEKLRSSNAFISLFCPPDAHILTGCSCHLDQTPNPNHMPEHD